MTLRVFSLSEASFAPAAKPNRTKKRRPPKRPRPIGIDDVDIVVPPFRAPGKPAGRREA